MIPSEDARAMAIAPGDGYGVVAEDGDVVGHDIGGDRRGVEDLLAGELMHTARALTRRAHVAIRANEPRGRARRDVRERRGGGRSLRGVLPAPSTRGCVLEPRRDFAWRCDASCLFKPSVCDTTTRHWFVPQARSNRSARRAAPRLRPSRSPRLTRGRPCKAMCSRRRYKERRDMPQHRCTATAR